MRRSDSLLTTLMLSDSSLFSNSISMFRSISRCRHARVAACSFSHARPKLPIPSRPAACGRLPHVVSAVWVCWSVSPTPLKDSPKEVSVEFLDTIPGDLCALLVVAEGTERFEVCDTRHAPSPADLGPCSFGGVSRARALARAPDAWLAGASTGQPWAVNLMSERQSWPEERDLAAFTISDSMEDLRDSSPSELLRSFALLSARRRPIPDTCLDCHDTELRSGSDEPNTGLTSSHSGTLSACSGSIIDCVCFDVAEWVGLCGWEPGALDPAFGAAAELTVALIGSRPGMLKAPASSLSPCCTLESSAKNSCCSVCRDAIALRTRSSTCSFLRSMSC
mmetsp:Transcript_47028/g.89785  ORF Transcript_47028/g.89785 Transcript_47028/m.89785 type:complete len:336 (-) Transcript_47028:774-1781(-)